MPITVKTFATLGEAAAALSADRDARFLAGGTLVMRAVNEGDAAIATIVRSTDRGFTQVRPAGARIEIGAGVTMAQILAKPSSPSFIPRRARSGGPAIRSMATVGGNLFAPAPYGDFTTALLALDATVSVQGGYGGREIPLEEFLAARERGTRGLVGERVAGASRPGPDVFRFRKVCAGEAEGNCGADDRRRAAARRRAGRRRARRLWRHGADADAGARGRARARRAHARCCRDRRGGRGRRRRERRPRATPSPATGTGGRSCPSILRRLLLGSAG